MNTSSLSADRLLELYDRIAGAPDAIARLRRFVLDLAVRGKLVEQNPDDEPASELLKRIAAEKVRLVKAGEVRKPRDLSNEEELEQPFNIPATWRWCRLDTIGTIIGGGTPSVADPDNFAEPGDGTPWLTPADLGGYHDIYIERGARDLTDKGLNSSSATMMPTGTVLFTSRAPIGYVAIAANPISTNQGFKSIVPYLADCSHFVALAMQTFAPDIDAKAPGTTFKEVSGKIVAGVAFPLPPLAEQRRIIAKADELTALLDRLEAARDRREITRDRLTAASLARLTAPGTDAGAFPAHARFVIDALPALTTRPEQIKTLRQTILDLAVRGKLVEQDPEDEPAAELLKRIAAEKVRKSRVGVIRKEKPLPLLSDAEREFDLPNGWTWSHLGALVLDSDSGWSPRTESHAREGDAWGVLKVSAVSWNHFDPTANKQLLPDTVPRLQAQVHKGDFLISRANTAELIARAVLVVDEPINLMMSDKLVRLHLTNQSDHRFVWLINNYADFARSYYETKATGASPSMKNVSRNTILKLPIPLPPLAEQHRIVAKVNELTTLLDRLEAALVTSNTTRIRLLEALLHEILAPDGERKAA